MKIIKGFIKRNIKLFIGIVVGGIIFGGGVYAATVAANTVSYSNTSSGIAATNVQGAIDELYEKTSSSIRAECRAEVFTVEWDQGSIHLSSVVDSTVAWCSISTRLGSLYYGEMSSCMSANSSSKSNALNSCCTEKCGSSTNSCFTTCRS